MKEEIETSNTSELPAVIGALLDTLDDKNNDVKQSVIESIQKISKDNPEVVIHAAVYFWELHRKISPEHMASLLKVMSDTCKHRGTCLSADLASSVAELAVNELIGHTEEEAAELLTALSKAHCTQAMGGLLTKLEPGILPHPTVVRTIGMIAGTNPVGMLSFFKITLTIVLPMLPQTKDDILRLAFCHTLGKFAEAINDYIMNEEENSSLEITKETYKEEICSAFDILTYNWLKTARDNQLISAILTALAPIIPLLPEEADCERIVKLTPMLINFCKKSSTRLPAVKVLAVLLNCATDNDKEALRPFLEYMHQVLSELVSVSPFEASRIALLTHYEVLQCSRSLVILYPEEGLDRILQQLKSPIVSHRSRALVVLRHLINTLPSEDDATLQRIALSLQDSLGESSVLQMVGAIVALAARPTLPLLPSQRATFVRYMITHCTSKNGETEAHADALHLLATTVNGAESWLWPCLIRALLDPACTASIVSILRSFVPLAIKIIHNGNSMMLQRDFPGTKVLGRCLELLVEPQYRIPIINFLKHAAPLFGHQLQPYWDEKLPELMCFLQNEQMNDIKLIHQRELYWEAKVVELLEESVKLEGEVWGLKLADELAVKASTPGVAPLLASLCSNNTHTTLLVELARLNGTKEEFARAVGTCSKRHLNTILKLMEESCTAEDLRKTPVRLLGLVKDAKAAATAEAAKAGLLRSYAEIAQKGDIQALYGPFETHIVPWIIKQLNDCKELSTKEAGLYALEKVANAVHPSKLPETTGLRLKGTALATLLKILQPASGYRPVQIYPSILKAAISLVRIPPILNPEETEIFLSTVLDKVIGASSEIIMLQPDIMQQVTDELGTVCSEVVSDSADALAELADILLPWMQSNIVIERKTTLMVLRTTLRSYYNSLKYTYPGGKLEPGKLIGRVLSWCADAEITLRPLVVDCVMLTLKIGTRHRSMSPDNNLDLFITDSKKTLVNDDLKVFYEGLKNLACAVSERVPDGEVISFAEGLIEGLLFRGEAGLAAGVALSQHFKIKGSKIARSDIRLVDNIIAQMRHMENISCRRSAAVAVKSLMTHHSEEVIEHLLSQPLPLDRGTEECWKYLGTSDDMGPRALQLLLVRLEANNLFAENATNTHPGKTNTASPLSLAAIVALRHLLQSTNNEALIEKNLPELLSVLLKYLAGWLHVEAPASVVNTKFGYVPNRDACKINPHAEVYSVLANALTVVDSSAASSLLNENIFSSESHAEESVVSTVRTMMRCISSRNDVLSSLAQSLGKLMISTIPIQRAVAATFYAELIGKVNCGVIWLDAIINTLHEGKADSSPLVRKLATIGLARIAYLEPEQIDEYFDNCMDALLDGLEEPASGEGGSEVVLESLRGLSVLLSVQSKRPVSPRVILSLKPFVEKESWEMRLAAISALGAVAFNWQKSITSPSDDITDHLLGCLPCLTVRLEDADAIVAKTAQETLWRAASLLQCDKLSHIICNYLSAEAEFNFEHFLRDLIQCLQEELPQRAIELRNAVVRGYARSENSVTRATAALILGLFGSPRPEDVQRLLQLLRDKDSVVRIRAARALSFCFTV